MALRLGDTAPNFTAQTTEGADSTATVRSVFVIGPDKKIKLTLTYPASTGRNFAEILRVIASLQLTANYKLATPADWNNGQDCIVVTAVSDEDGARMFPRGMRKVKPYLRYTPQPNHPEAPALARSQPVSTSARI